MQNADYQINVEDNFSETAENMTHSANSFAEAVENVNGWLKKMSQTLAVWNVAGDNVRRFNDSLNELFASGISLDDQMKKLSAAAGVTGDTLRTIEKNARDTARTFGIDASQAVEVYRLLLSQLSSELGSCPDALKAMGNSIATTSKLMGGDGVAAAELLVTAMNEYGISLQDPMEASEEMARMMNVMAAAAQTGSAGMPAIKMALEQCGVAARAANVSFEETNAAIQLLDKAGKKGAESGAALRSVMSALASESFLSDTVLTDLQSAGVDVNALTDSTLSLSKRLQTLKPVASDTDLLANMFGIGNVNAVSTLVNGIDNLNMMTEAVTGTAAAEEQAAAIMDSYAERQARVNQYVEDFRIGVFNAVGGLGIWTSAIAGVLMPLSQLISLVADVVGIMTAVRNIQWGTMWLNIQRAVYLAWMQLKLMNRELVTGQFASRGFMTNIMRATIGLVRFATVGVFQALKGIGAMVISLVTGGTASATFSAIATASFSAFKASAVSACRAVGMAIRSIPIVGWIAAAVAALAAIGIHFWKTSAKFRAVMKGLWASFKAMFTGIGKLASNTFGAISDLLKACFRLDAKGIGTALDKLKGGFADYGSQIGTAFDEAYDAEMAASQKKREEAEATDVENDFTGGPDPTGGSLVMTGTGQTGGGNVRNVTVNVDKLVERFEIHTTNMSGDMNRVKEMVSEVLLSALNDVNLVM